MGLLASIENGASAVGNAAEAGANWLGQALQVPIVSPLLEAPRMIHDSVRNTQFEKAKEQYAHPQSGGLGQMPQGPPAAHPGQGNPQQGHAPTQTIEVPVHTMAHLIHKAGGLAALHGSMDPQGGPPAATNMQGAGPTPSPMAQGVPAQQNSPVTPPSEPTQTPLPVNRSKQFVAQINKIYSPETLARLSKEDPTQYKKIMAMRGIATYDQGDASAAMSDLTSAGIPASQSIAILQQQRRQKDISNFLAKTGETAPPSGPSPGVLAGTGGSSAQQPFPKSREQYLAENLPKLAGIKEPTNLAQAHELIMTNAQGYQPMAVLSKQEAGRVGADYATSLTPGTTTEQARQSMAKIMQRVPKALAPEVGKALKDAYRTFVAERKNAETEQFRQASTRLKQSGIGPKVIAGASSLYHQMVASNPAVKDVLQMEPYYHRAMAVYGKARTGSPMAQIPFIESYIRSFSNQALRAYLLSKNIDVQSLSQKMEGRLQQIKNGGAGFTADSLTQMKDILDSAHEANLESIAPTIAHFSKASESGGPEISKAFKEMVGGIPKPSSSTGQKVGDKIDLGNGIKGTIIGVSP